MLKFVVIVVAAGVFAYYAYYAFSGAYYDVPFFDFI